MDGGPVRLLHLVELVDAADALRRTRIMDTTNEFLNLYYRTLTVASKSSTLHGRRKRATHEALRAEMYAAGSGGGGPCGGARDGRGGGDGEMGARRGDGETRGIQASGRTGSSTRQSMGERAGSGGRRARLDGRKDTCLVGEDQRAALEHQLRRELPAGSPRAPRSARARSRRAAAAQPARNGPRGLGERRRGSTARLLESSSCV